MVAGNTVAPGVKRTPGPAASHACGTWKPRQGPASAAVGAAGKPTVRGAQSPGGNRMPRKRMPAPKGSRKAGARDRSLQPVLSV